MGQNAVAIFCNTPREKAHICCNRKISATSVEGAFNIHHLEGGGGGGRKILFFHSIKFEDRLV